jgi:hypothetical protein
MKIKAKTTHTKLEALHQSQMYQVLRDLRMLFALGLEEADPG